jgi:hypothetical protein
MELLQARLDGLFRQTQGRFRHQATETVDDEDDGN